MLPYLGWLDVVTAISRKVDALFDQVIEKHRISGSDDDHPNRKDLVHVYSNFKGMACLG